MKKLFLIPLCFLSLFSSCQHQTIDETEKTLVAYDNIPEGIQKLLKAYPGHFKAVRENHIIWKDGSKMPFDDLRKDKTFSQLINEADLEDQVMGMKYPKDKKFQIPAQKQDPGRVRYEPFFKKMYGNSPQEVKAKLTTIVWLPKTLNIKLDVTTVNDIHQRLQAISNRLDTMPHLHQYLKNPGGTFNWRNIAGTNRLSMHSFGMTIDLNVEYSDYWRWATKTEEGDGSRIIEYKNRIPLEIVEIFESYGFVWGGKWYHYDTMHFEYRPELLVE